jgi:hypothetical protein
VCNSLTPKCAAVDLSVNNNNKNNDNKLYDVSVNACNLVNSKFTNSYLIKSSKPKKVSDSSSKYFSAGALSMTEPPSSDLPLCNKKHASSALTAKNNSTSSSPTHHAQTTNTSMNRSLRNFFGKLIRTSLVNINDASYGKNGGGGGALVDLSKPGKSSQTPVVVSTTAAALDLSPPVMTANGSSFKRGGFRSTADARLQSQYTTPGHLGHKSKSVSNHQNREMTGHNLSVANTIPAFILDTLSFAKWPTHQVCEWLNKNGFGLYFPPGPDGTYCHKWIKNGLQLLQATQYEYEKVTFLQFF